jgi:replicative DNA helicase
MNRLLSDPQAELCALWHLHASDPVLLNMLSPKHFTVPDNRAVFEAMQACHSRDDLSPAAVDDELARRKSPSAGYAWLQSVASAPYLGAPHQVARKLSSCLARRKAMGFRVDERKDLPDQFIGTGRELQDILAEEQDPMRGIAERISKGVPVVPTGFADIDRMLGGGIEQGAVFVIAARTGVGKTAMAINIAARAVEQERSAFFLTLEMAEERIYERFLQRFWNETRDQVRKHAAEMALARGFTVAKPAPRLPKVLACLQANLHHDLLIVDYFQLIAESTGDNLTQQLEIVSNELKRFASEARKPLILLAQLNRNIESDSRNREPELSDLRGCGALEQDAHAVTFLWDENAKPPAAKPGQTMQARAPKGPPRYWWILRKNRSGPLGRLPLQFEAERMRFASQFPDL